MQILASVTRRYISPSPPPPPPPTGADPMWPDVLLLLPMETNFVNAKNNGEVINNGAYLSPSANAAPFGTNGGVFNEGGRLSLPYLGTALNGSGALSGDTWTVEFWINATFVPDEYPSTNRVIAVIPGGTPLQPYHISMINDGVALQGYNGVDHSRFSFVAFGPQSGYSLIPGVPNHVAIVKTGNGGPYGIFVKIFINGRNFELFNANPDIPVGGHVDSGNDGTIGGDPYLNGALWLNASLKDFRITNAIRYTADFTPPTGPFPQG